MVSAHYLRRLGLIVAIWSLHSVPAMAIELCRFETECFEAEACQPAEWTVGVSAGIVSTDFGDLTVVSRAEGVVVAAAPGMVVVIGRGEGAAARASVHMEGPLVVSYLGTCQEAD